MGPGDTGLDGRWAGAFEVVGNLGDGIRVVRGDVYLDHARVCRNTGRGIVISNGTLANQNPIVCENGSDGMLGDQATRAVGATWGTSVADGSPSSLIVGGLIVDNGGDGVRWERGDGLVASQTNIISNAGLGISNVVTTTTVDARGDWWGSASGPGPVGPGAGDGVSGGVSYSGWRSAPFSLGVSACGAPYYAHAGGTAVSVTRHVHNWLVVTDAVTLTLRDSRGWLIAPTAFTVTLEDGLGASAARLSVRPGTPAGTTDIVTTTARSCANPTATASATFQVIAAHEADLTLRIRDSADPVAIGQPLTYTLSVSNAGPDAATAVVVTGTLLPTVTVGAITTTQGTCGGANPGICRLGTLNASTTVTLTFSMTPREPGTVRIRASVSSDAHDPEAAFNAQTESTSILTGVNLALMLR